MWFNIIGFWAVGFTTGYTLAFRVGLGLPGVWWGILSGVITTGARAATANTLMTEVCTTLFADVSALHLYVDAGQACCCTIFWMV